MRPFAIASVRDCTPCPLDSAIREADATGPFLPVPRGKTFRRANAAFLAVRTQRR